MLHERTSSDALSTLPAASKTVLYFSADWCGPCKSVKPVLERLSEERVDVNFVRVDIDADGDLVRQHQVRGIPTVVVLDETGEAIARLNGTSINTAIGQYL